ncbi:MAG: hypothetical protein WBP26_04495 [Candidatus Saccharimonadales bacterium]
MNSLIEQNQAKTSIITLTKNGLRASMEHVSNKNKNLQFNQKQ